MSLEQTTIPMHYKPWPHQVRAWQRRRSGQYVYDFKLWCRQSGKDTDDIQWDLNMAWNNPGTQSAYIGLDNVWINNNIFNKYIDGRRHWDDYPTNLIDPKDTAKEVYMLNNPQGLAPARIKYIGFLNSEGLIGSSYDRFTISELSLYDKDAFNYIKPIWDQKLAMGKTLGVNFNGTPRGLHNIMYDMLCEYTEVDDPKEFPGAHGNCFVDLIRVQDVLVPDGEGSFRPLYTEAELERLKSRYLRAYGNLNLYYQEYECDFTVVNAGLVYQGIQKLREDGRCCSINLDPGKPVYCAWDISSKASTTDATSAIIYQYYNNLLVIYDTYEARGKSLIECITELSQRPYFSKIRLGVLPWDSDRSASSETPAEEAAKMFPNINWHTLSKERVDRGIAQVRKMLPNTVINKDNCAYLMECFDHYEFKRLEKMDDWAPKPIHNKWSHMMDALRYAVMGINEIQYFKLNDEGTYVFEVGEYGGFDDQPKKPRGIMSSLRTEDQNQGGFYGGF